MEDNKFAKLALEMAGKSFEEGAFPAGAVIVQNGKVIAKNTSAQYPNFHLHAESKTIDESMVLLKVQLTDCTLYCSMQPCLMCLSRAYWAGIRRIVYVVKKSSVDPTICYETDLEHEKLLENFNEKIEMTQVPELESVGLELYKKWYIKTFAR